MLPQIWGQGMNDGTLNILIGGEAGQGLVTVGQLLAKSLVRSGYSIVVTQSYQSRIRGGHNTFAIRVGIEEVTAPKNSIDLLIAFDSDTVTLHQRDLYANGLIVLDEALHIENNLALKVPFKDLAQERFSNIVALGVAGFLLGLDEELMAQTVDDFFGKNVSLAAENRHVLSVATEWAGTHATSSHNLIAVSNPPQRLMPNLNECNFPFLCLHIQETY